MREGRIYWNHDWQFVKEYEPSMLGKDWNVNKVETVTLPHTVQEVPYHYFDESIYQKVCGYRRCFQPEEAWQGKRVLMTIEAAGHSAKVYLNGKQLAEHRNGYTAFTVELTKELCFGQENVLVVEVNSGEDQNIPPFGHVIDYMTFGGLYREVYLEIKEEAYLEDVFARTKGIIENKPLLDSEVIVRVGEQTYINSVEGYELRQTLLDSEGNEAVNFKAGELRHSVQEIEPWEMENPRLYILRTQLYKGEILLDTREDRIGFREVEFKTDGFYLNGKKRKLRGLNRHQSYPYVGYAMPKSMQVFDADILKNELGVNAVRTSHYPQSHYFIDRCDELGLLVFTEIPGWQHIGDEAWQQQAVVNTEEMVMQYRNHPSIILWGVRINESQDNDAFYLQTNEVAHRLDDTRQTSGVRYIQKSSLLEDVYAFNDFSHEGFNHGCQKKSKVTPDTKKGYLISEYNGHMYPTKSYDCEDHRVEHMLRHARVMDAYYGEEDIAGGFGWCMFDYNTHKDFGSGDRICYHGVTDMFRNPKLAAALYQSQSEAQDVLEITSSMDIGEHPGCLMKDIYAITNADSVRLYKNDVFIKEFTKENTGFKNLPHGPILIDDFIGDLMVQGEGFSKAKSEDVKSILMSACKHGVNNLPPATLLKAAKCILFRGMKMQEAVDLYSKYIGNWGGTATVYRYEAIKDGKVVKTVEKKPMTKGHLEVRTSHTVLKEGQSYDVAAVRIQAMSEEGNLLNYSHAPITLRTEGDIAFIGPSVISLAGGMSGTYVKSVGRAGQGRLIVESEAFGKVEIAFEVTNN